MVRDRFLASPLACGWQVIHQTQTHGPYTTHCEATLAAMLLAQIASEVGMNAEVVFEAEAKHSARSANPSAGTSVRYLADFVPKPG